MKGKVPLYTPEEFARRGDEIYAQLRGELESIHRGRMMAIDIESGEYEIDDKLIAACKKLLARLPDAQIWGVKIGFPFVNRLGFRATTSDAK